ncbi:MAG: hypothetical protein FWD25_11360 [Clostridia bacterium]|nr:hypothetical protein [Clostridia bacterium]
MNKTAKLLLIPAIIFTLVFGAWATARIIHSVNFSLNCSAYLKRAAEANTVEMAKVELANALEYAEQNNLTEGVVSVFLRNPTNDIGFWYNNLKAAHTELDNLPEDASALERTNVLMKLRESLTDRSSSDGTKVVHPEGISIYPHNVLYFWWGLISMIALGVSWTFFGGIVYENHLKRKKEAGEES